MKIDFNKIKKNDGYLVYTVFIVLSLGKLIDIPQEFIKKIFKNHQRGYVEIWYISWLIFGLIILTNMDSFSTWLIVTVLIIFSLRFFDLLRIILGLNFGLILNEDNSRPNQISIIRSFFLLILNFFEFAVIFGIFNISIYIFFPILQQPPPLEIYFNSIKSMTTSGAIEINFSHSSKYFLVIIAILQPLISIFLVTMAINRLLEGKKP